MAGKEVATISNGGGLLARYKQGDNPFLADAGNDDYFGAFLKFNGNNGDYNYGDDYAEEIPHGEQLLFNLETAQHGWICWVDGEVADEVNILVASGKELPKVSDLEDYGPYKTHSDGTKDGWQEQYVLHAYWEAEELAFTLKLSSKSGLRAAKNLLRQYGKSYGVKIGDDGEIQIPVVEIGSVAFDVKGDDGKVNKKAGKKHAPSFKITEWADKSEVADLFEAADGDDADDYDDGEDDAPAPEPETTSRGRGRATDKPAETTSGRGRGRSEPAEDKAETSGRGRRQRGEPEPSDDDGDQGGDDEGAEDKVEVAGRGRRTRVVHAEPQDDGDDPAPEERQQSARGRRGRTRG